MSCSLSHAPSVWPLLALAWFGHGCGFTLSMPGESYAGPKPVLAGPLAQLRTELERDVVHLATTIGERNTAHPADLDAAARYIEAELLALGYRGRRYVYEVDGVRCANIEVVLTGTRRPEQIVVVGAHYDSAPGTPGANDNASGVAALLALARRFADRPGRRTLHLVFFANEEPPYFRTRWMGSRIYAQRLRAADANVIAMLSLETIGYYDDAPDTQHYPFPFSLFYPSEGNFLAFIANPDSVDLLERVVGTFRAEARLASAGAAAPESVPGIDWSDQQGFWAVGYPGIMVTDTAPNRDPHYHTPEDTPDKLDFDRLALAVKGIEAVVQELLGPWPPER